MAGNAISKPATRSESGVVTPDPTKNGSRVYQIYKIINEVARQSIGSTAIQAIDTNSFIALGSQVLEGGTEGFCNTLVKRIYRTIVTRRAYTSQLRGLVLGDHEYGAIMQKIKIEVPDWEADQSWELEDGKSVDMYIVNRPKVKQKFFDKMTVRTMHVTIQRATLKQAFLSADAMDSFLSAIYVEVRNKLELSMENLSRLCIANFAVNTGESQRIHMLSMYAALSGKTAPVSAQAALFDREFMVWTTALFNSYRRKLTEMSVTYNADGYTRHTPKSDQRFIIHDDYLHMQEAIVMPNAYHNEFLDSRYNIALTRWQSPDKPMQMLVTNSEGTVTQLDNVVAMLFDKDALGTNRREEDILTTPVNAAGRYYNTFWHEEQSWINDLSENGIVFLLD